MVVYSECSTRVVLLNDRLSYSTFIPRVLQLARKMGYCSIRSSHAILCRMSPVAMEMLSYVVPGIRDQAQVDIFGVDAGRSVLV